MQIDHKSGSINLSALMMLGAPDVPARILKTFQVFLATLLLCFQSAENIQLQAIGTTGDIADWQKERLKTSEGATVVL